MPIPPHHTASCSVLSTDGWTTEILPLLPADLEEQARAHGAFVRVRGLANATDLVRALLVYALDDCSFRMLGMWSTLTAVGNLSDTAWRKRLQRANSFLGWLLGALLAATVVTASDLTPRQRRVRLVDATRLYQLGGTGDDWRVHLSYDLLGGCVDQVRVTDQHGSEQLTWLAGQPGDILVADRGYGYRGQITAARQRGMDVVLRVHLPSMPLETDTGEPFDAVRWVGQQHAAVVTWHGWYRYQGQRIAIRVVASRLPADRRASAQRRLRKQARKRQRAVSATSMLLAGWWVLVTTLDDAWDASAILRLYRARWQVELLFKRMKQQIGIARLRGQTVVTLEATIRAQLVAWVLQEQQIAQIRAALPDGSADPHAPVSLWLLSALSLQTLRVQVRGTWTLRQVIACLPQLRRFLVGSRRGRRQQAADMIQWLQERFRAEPLAGVAA